MNCANHPETAAAAYCRACGKALCQTCQRTARGTIYCEEHVPMQTTTEAAAPNPAPSYSSPYSAPATAAAGVAASPDLNVSPGLAFLLGLIPGVGAIYNGQYAKGLVHVVVLGTLIGIMTSDLPGPMYPLFGMMIFAWFLYMAFEAHHTAKRRQLGIAVDEFSSLIPLKGRAGQAPVAPLVLIGLGVVFLLHNLDILRFSQIQKYWPTFLIALGVYLLYERFSGGQSPRPPEASHEQR
jgi:TM2 domain-containing membrane protein YozV